MKTYLTFRNAIAAMLVAGLALGVVSQASARPSPKSKQVGAQPQNFLRQLNVYSNIDFLYGNRGVLFNSGQGQVEGLFWPRGSGNSYIFGEGLWFATKKSINGRRHKLCDLGYNPNSGAGWYLEGEYNSVMKIEDDGADPNNKYISYVSPRYDKTTGAFIKGSSNKVPSPYYSWPLWDTSSTKTLKRNFYFGDYISDVTKRNNDKLKKNGKPAVPAMISEEDIVNIYTDQDVSGNPEFKQGTGYPFGIDVHEVIYSWSFGRYRDMIFLRQKVINRSPDSLLDCWVAPAFDPDLASPDVQHDHNSFVDSALVAQKADVGMLQQLREPYKSHPEKLNMGIQWHNGVVKGKQYGMVGFSFLESPVIDQAGNIITNDEETSLGGYGPTSLFQTKSLGLVTFRKWRIINDPSTNDLRYDFVSAGIKEGDGGVEDDVRLLMATGPFTLPPGRSVETVVAIMMAQASNTDDRKNFSATLQISDFAHQVFGEVDSVKTSDTTNNYFINHFLSPVPPDVPNVTTQSLDKGVLVMWDSAAERSIDLVSGMEGSSDSVKSLATLPFLGYQLWRTTRSDHDSTIRPEGQNPNVMLGSWQLYDYSADSVFDKNGHFNHFHFKRTNTTPHSIPHSYLDVGDDNHDGVVNGSEGLLNGKKYYYYVIAFDEFDSLNQIGPLYTAIVPPKNFAVGVPSKPVYLTTFAGDTANLGAQQCLAGGDGTNQTGGLRSIRLDVVDTGRFAKLFTNDEIYVSFQPRWNPYNHNYQNNSYLQLWVDITNKKNTINNTYKELHGVDGKEAYFFPTTVTGSPAPYQGAISVHVNGTVTCDSVFSQQFTTDVSRFAPNQTVAQTFRVLADVNFEQLCSPYRLGKVDLISSTSTKDIIHPSVRLVKDPKKDFFSGDTQNTRPSYQGALGEVTYEVSFGNVINPGPYAISLTGDPAQVIHPRVLPVDVRVVGCVDAILRHVQDSATDMQLEQDYTFAPDTLPGPRPSYHDPDTMYVPNPGWFEVDAWHYADAEDFPNAHLSPTGPLSYGHGTGSTGAFYFPIGGGDNIDNSTGTNLYHLVVHRLKVGGAEIILNAPEVNDVNTTGDPLGGLKNPHMNDFQPGDKITLAFTGMMKNLPFPGTKFVIKTEGGSSVDPANASLYKGSVLDQVQVVPNPYIVTHEGQTSTDNAKLFFTRLPPRATIEIYALDGTLISTIEHTGYQSTVSQDPNDNTKTVTTYDYAHLSDRSTVEEWNLLTSGKQRVGSQVLFARVVSKDPISNAVIGETTTKFAVVVGLSK